MGRRENTSGEPITILKELKHTKRSYVTNEKTNKLLTKLYKRAGGQSGNHRTLAKTIVITRALVALKYVDKNKDRRQKCFKSNNDMFDWYADWVNDDLTRISEDQLLQSKEMESFTRLLTAMREDRKHAIAASKEKKARAKNKAPAKKKSQVKRKVKHSND